MARMRTVKPEFWTSEQIMECSPNARLLFIGMWNFCDDAGIHPASAKTLKAEVFPSDDLTAPDVQDMLNELIGNGLVMQYEVGGKQYLCVTGWDRHQKIDRPNFKHPKPDHGEYRRTLDDESTNDRRTLDDESTNDRRTLDDESTPDLSRELSKEGKVNPLPSVGGAGGVQADLLTESPDASPSAPPLDGDDLPFAADPSAGYGPGAEAAPLLQGVDPPRRTRGARLPADWVLPKPWGEWALAQQPTWTPEHVRWVAENFRDYWLGRAGKDAVKVDWMATWRTWVRKEAPLINGARASPGARPQRRSLLVETGIIGGNA